MPLLEGDLPDVRERVMKMLTDTIATFVVIEQHVGTIYGDGDRAQSVQAAIKECLDDFWRETDASGEPPPRH